MYRKVGGNKMVVTGSLVKSWSFHVRPPLKKFVPCPLGGQNDSQFIIG